MPSIADLIESGTWSVSASLGSDAVPALGSRTLAIPASVHRTAHTPSGVSNATIVPVFVSIIDQNQPVAGSVARRAAAD
jgi:hypothetical protein